MTSLISVFFPFAAGIFMLFSKFESKEVYRVSLVTLAITALCTIGGNLMFFGEQVTFLKLVLNITYSFKIDEIAVFFTSIASIIWLIIGKYATGYMSHSYEHRRFFGFYLMSLGALLGVFYANNPATMYSFFEILSMSAFVMVIHEKSNESLLAGRKFIYYSIFGASLGLVAIIYLYAQVPNPDFIAGGLVEIAAIRDRDGVLLITFFAILGFGCKAGLYPLHSWLAAAHPVAPAPASAVLSGLVTKAGVVAILRMIYYFVGVDILGGTWVQTALIIIALLTIIMGSMLATREVIIKKRLAYSSVSQVSYVLFGLFLMNTAGFTGALLQVLFHAMAKCLLFIVAGTIIFKTHFSRVDEIYGLGNKLKPVFIMLAIGGLSLVGIPLTGGFVSKWYLAEGALSYDMIGIFGVLIIMLSALLTAQYLFTPVAKAFFAKKEEMVFGKEPIEKNMLVPMLVLAFGIIAIGVYPMPVINFISSIAELLSLGGAV